jgi:sensor c-di-GMP phosphodiesterase-like protein
MRDSAGISIAIAIGVAAAAAPILISIHLSWKEGLDDESTIALSYAQNALRRTSEMGDQIGSGLDRLTHSHYSPCSPAEIDLMRQIDVGSSYLQAVGRIDGNDLVCNSLGVEKPIPLGPPTLITASGAVERLNIKLPIAGNQPLDVFSMDGFAFLLDPRLPLDIPTQGPRISMAIFVPSSPQHALIASRSADLRPEWFRPIPRGSSVTFTSSGYVVAITRAANIDVAVVAAAPLAYMQQRVLQFSFIFVPLGLLCAAALAWAVTHISRVRLSLPSILRAAARRKEFYVEYQPIVDLESRRWIGAEALVRWRRSGGHIVQPDSFIPAAEESGVIPFITACVAEIVASDLPSLLKNDPNFVVAINLSAADLRSRHTVELLERALHSSGARPANIEVEATERGLLQGHEARDIIAAIRALGIKVSIDDFGAGYSSLSYLQTLGVDALKIDRSFVETIGPDGATSKVVSHIVGMAHALDLTTVAEGIETEAQARFLCGCGVRYAQGWLFDKSMNIASLCAALEKHGRRCQMDAAPGGWPRSSPNAD